MFGHMRHRGEGRGHHHHPHHHDHEGFGFARHGFGRGRFGGRHGGPFGEGGEDEFRAGRMLVQGDLRLVALALIAEAPRHGYEIIKLIEEKTGGWYAPSPGVIYPTLTFLDESGFVSVEAEGNKKLYAITEAGRAHLDDNRTLVEAVMARLAAIGERAERVREARGGPGGDEPGRHGHDRHGRPHDRRRDGPELPLGVEAAVLNLRDAIARRLAADPNASTDIVESLFRIARDVSGQ